MKRKNCWEGIYWEGICWVTEKVPKSKEFPVHTMLVDIGHFTTVNNHVIGDCKVWFQLLGEPNWERLQLDQEYLKRKIAMISPAITGNERMFQSVGRQQKKKKTFYSALTGKDITIEWLENSSQWFWWGNKMIWKDMTYDPYRSFHVCWGYIWSAAWSSWPHKFMDSKDRKTRFVKYPRLTIWDMAKAIRKWLSKLDDNWCINLENWFSEVSWISFWWQVSMALASELVKFGYWVDKLIPIEATTKPTAFIIWTWVIYDKLCNMIPEFIDYWNKWLIEWVITMTMAQMWHLLSRSPDELTERFKNRPDLIENFIKWDLDFPKWNYLKEEGHEHYKFAVGHVIGKLKNLRKNYKDILKSWGKKEIYDTLLWTTRIFWFLLFNTPEFYKTKTKEEIVKFLDGQFYEFIERSNLEAMRLLLEARNEFNLGEKHMKRLVWVKTTFIYNQQDTLYTPPSIKRSVLAFNRIIKESNKTLDIPNKLAGHKMFSSSIWHDAPFWALHSTTSTNEEKTFYDILKEVRAS